MAKTIYNFQYREEENGQTLMSNAVFGKTTKNLRKRLIVQFVNNQSKARKVTSKPSFHAFRMFNEDLVAVHMSLSKQTYLCGLFHFRSVKNTHVRLSLQLYEDKVWT
jgi:hypothetical protein